MWIAKKRATDQLPRPRTVVECIMASIRGYILAEDPHTDAKRQGIERVAQQYRQQCGAVDFSLTVAHERPDSAWFERRGETHDFRRSLNVGDHVIVWLPDLGKRVRDIRRALGYLIRCHSVCVLIPPGQLLPIDRSAHGLDSLSPADRERLETGIALVNRDFQGCQVKAAMRRLVAQGRPINGNRRYGYQRQTTRHGVLWRSDRHERLWLKRIKTWKAEGVTLRQIHDRLWRARARTSTGDYWSLRQVGRVSRWLKNGGLEGLVHQDAQLLAIPGLEKTLTDAKRREVKQLLTGGYDFSVWLQFLKTLAGGGGRAPHR